METLWQDLRLAARGFRRNPTFTLTAVLAVALGIGATTAVFSVVDRLLFRSLPYADAGRLVSVGLVAPIEPQDCSRYSKSRSSRFPRRSAPKSN